jgi:hypothetical protein
MGTGSCVAWGRGVAAALALALALAGCGQAPGGGGGVRGVGSREDAGLMVRTVAEAADLAVRKLTVDGILNNVTVTGLTGTATIAGNLFHTQRFDGVTNREVLDADVTIVFAAFNVRLDSGVVATVTGTVNLLLGDPTPQAGAHFFPPDQPVEIAGAVTATYEGPGDTALDAFRFDAAGLRVDVLHGSLTTQAGLEFRY